MSALKPPQSTTRIRQQVGNMQEKLCGDSGDAATHPELTGELRKLSSHTRACPRPQDFQSSLKVALLIGLVRTLT